MGLRGGSSSNACRTFGRYGQARGAGPGIALDPELILYDEPFVGQDPIYMGVLVQLIKRLNQALALSSVVLSHDIKETLSIADYLYLLADGEGVG